MESGSGSKVMMMGWQGLHFHDFQVCISLLQQATHILVVSDIGGEDTVRRQQGLVDSMHPELESL